MPRILLLAALLVMCTGCFSDDSDTDSAPARASSADCEAAEGAPATLPAGQRLAWAEGARLWTLTEDCPAPQLRSEHDRDIGRIRWSPNGESIAFHDGRGTTVLRLDAGSSPRSFGSEEFAWLGNDRVVIGRSRLVEAGATLVVVHVASGEERVIDGALAFAAEGESIAYWKDAGACPPEVLPQDLRKEGGTPIGRRCPRLAILPPGATDPSLTVDVTEMLAVMPDGVPSLGLTSPGSIDWSPDREWIIFKMCGIAASGCVDTQHVFELHVGSGVLTYVGDTAGPIAWAPDSSSYVYVQSGGRPYDAYPRPMVVRRPGGLGDGDTISPSGVEDWQPAWSPDASAVVFTSFPSMRLGDCQVCAPEVPEEGIWTASLEARTQLTSSPEWVDSSPRWSGDGEWILFVRNGPEHESAGYPKTQLWIMRSDGSDQRMVLDLSGAGPHSFPLDYLYDWWTPPD